MDRRLRLVVREDGKIDAMIDAPYMGRLISSTRFHCGWKFAIKLIDKCNREWNGMDYSIHISAK